MSDATIRALKRVADTGGPEDQKRYEAAVARTRSALEQAAIEFVRARVARDRLRSERSSIACEVEYEGGFGECGQSFYDPGIPACWRMVHEGLTEVDPDTVCGPCMERISAHERYAEASKEATRAWRALRKAACE